MSGNQLQELEACGQSVWTDVISRQIQRSGTLARYIDEDGITGVTANPTIFEKAIAGSHDYDDTIRELASRGHGPDQIYEALAIEDVGAAADLLRPVYDRTQGHDGYVSIEVSPELAADTQGTIDEAKRFWSELHRPNIFIKVPATPEGMPAIEQLISEGINVNITLIFAVEVYEQVMDAYLTGLERRVAAQQPIDRIASVASFFVSRVDTLVDKLLDEQATGADAAKREELQALAGKAAVANAKIAYQRFEQTFGQERFQRLGAQGAMVQRPLWASTSTKNPSYPDTYYVANLVGPETVNTMPPQTINAVRDHGQIECNTVKSEVEEAHRAVERLGSVGIDMTAVTNQLTVEGIKSFADSLNQLFDAIEKKSSLILAGQVAREKASLDGQQSDVDAALKDMAQNDFLSRLWNKDPSLWKPNPTEQSEITDRLGWLHVSDCMLEYKDRFTEIASAVRDAGYTHAVVLGMGGSSLAPYVFARSFGRQAGFPELLVLDSTDPAAILDVERAIEPSSTLFIVSSKSGSTTETLSHFHTFWEIVRGSEGDRAGEHFVAITDPGTSLEKLARERGFRSCYLNPSDIGGRYSALSYFGLVPAAVMGVDVEKLLQRGMRMEHACAPSVPPDKNPGAWLGTIMAELALTGRDKVTFFLSPPIEALGLWLEQLLAESTGKEGKGLVPVPDNPPGSSGDYDKDHLFVYIRLDSADNRQLDAKVEELERAQQPVVRVQMEDLFDLAPEFFRWEFATAVAGALLGINAFDQPNVQESKDNTKRLLDEYLSTGSLPEPRAVAEQAGMGVFANEAAQPLLSASSNVESALGSFFSHIHAPEYVAIMAYIDPTAEHDAQLAQLRLALRHSLRVAVTVGYGPRFLHSTGQLHKGGTPEGLFLQVTAEANEDVSIPGQRYSYGTLIRAQALGDFESLEQHGRPAVRIHLENESSESMHRLVQLVEASLSAQAPVRG